jgi:hypothetical protein
MDWYELSQTFHKRTFPHDCRLDSLNEEWQRELAALWRLEADVNNGAYLQFICNWGRESYVYASQGLKRIGAVRMARIVDTCQSLVDEHWGDQPLDFGRMREELPANIVEVIYDLSYNFMDYPEDVGSLGMSFYRDRVVD